jgi:hypothetical protein
MRRVRGSWPLLLILAGFLALATATSLINPLFESTDEIRHYRYIRQLVVEHALPIQGEETVRSQSHHPPLYYLLSAVASGWVPTDHSPQYEHLLNPFWGYRNWAVGVDNKLQYHHGPAERSPFNAQYLAAYISRWVNVVLGGVAVLLTYAIGRRIWPGKIAFAWGAAALVAFNPQFIYLSAAMNNDIIAATAGAAVLLQCVVIVQEGPARGRILGLGLVYGLALLSKFHLAILGGVIALAIALAVLLRDASERVTANDPLLILENASASVRRRVNRVQVQAVLRQGGLYLGGVLGVAALVAGWWFARNWWLYGDPTGLNKVNELWLGRSASGNWWALKQGLPYLWSSLWGRFGYGQIPLPSWIYSGLLIFCVVAMGGYAFGNDRKTGERDGTRRAVLFLAAVTLVGFAAVVMYYILIQPAGPMGRFLFPALPALAVLLMEGLRRWPVLRGAEPWRGQAVTLGMGCLALLALGGYLAPAVRYPPATPLTPGQNASTVQFGDVARMRVAGVQPETAQPGEPVFVTVQWEPLRRTPVPYAVYVHLVDDADVLVAQRDTWPGLGRAPTDGWEPGQAFTDVYRIDLPEAAYAPTRAVVRVGLYETMQGRLPVVDAGGSVVDDGVTAGSIEIAPRPGEWPNPQHANFGDEIMLMGYTLEPRNLAAGETFTLTLYWRALRSPQQPYMVFAQVIDPDWQVWGSLDGAGPGWVAGETAQDVRRITLRPDTPPGSYPVQVGLFHEQTGRLPVLAPQGHYIDERVLLGPIRVHD